jgi:DNA-binding transcriptional MocR family regulator
MEGFQRLHTMNDRPYFAYQAVYRYLNRLVDNAPCGSVTKLPSLRHLALRLKVSVSTVQYAYCLLEKEGRVCSIAKSGYFTLPSVDGQLAGAGEDVLDILHCYARRPGMFVLSHDDPTVLMSLDSSLLVLERELNRQYPRRANPLFQPFGELELRTAVADRYTSCAMHSWCSDNVYIGADLRGILKIVLNALALRGGTVLVESPCSWAILRVLKSFDIRVIEMPVDASHCVDLGGVNKVLTDEGIGLALLPSRVSTVNGLAPIENRRQLADLLNRHGVWVLEDDSQGELCFDPSAERLRDWINPRRLMVMSAFDKLIGPEAPYGYLLSKHMRMELQRQFLVRSFSVPPIRQKAIARLHSSGRLEQHLIDLRHLLEDRMLALAGLLKEHLGARLRFNLPSGGSAIWAESNRPVNMRRVFDRLLKQGVFITPGEVFSLQGLHQHNVQISFAFDWSHDVAKALVSLDLALRQERL